MQQIDMIAIQKYIQQNQMNNNGALEIVGSNKGIYINKNLNNKENRAKEEIIYKDDLFDTDEASEHSE